MKLKDFLKQNTLGAVLANLALAFAIVAVLAVAYFYVFLPNNTNHDETITIPDLHGMKLEELETFLKERELRYEVEDSIYHEEFPPLTVLRQFPKAGSTVKENRMIYISVNQVLPPTVPVPDLANPTSPSSLINAQAILKSNGLKAGKRIYQASPFFHIVGDMMFQGKRIEAGTRIPKGSVIDLVVGDGKGPADFTIGNLIGDQFETAKFKLAGWNLHLGSIEIPEDVDTTGIEIYVFKQNPLPGDSVRVGDPVDLILAPKDYAPVEEENNDEDANEVDNQ
jgi:eukaryotic-like serine/threonine-protein kinase